MSSKSELLAKYPGLLVEKNRNGTPRYRVRVEGSRATRITLDVGPEHPLFIEAYYCARIGERVAFSEQYIPTVAATGNLQKMIARMLNGAKRRARKERVDFDLKKSDILEMLDAQKGRCAISGILFDLSASETRRRPFAPSLDRIATKGGYTASNVRLTTIAANLARGDWPDEVLLSMARGIVSRCPAHR